MQYAVFFELHHQAHALQLLPLARQMQHEQQVRCFERVFLYVAFFNAIAIRVHAFLYLLFIIFARCFVASFLFCGRG